MENVQGKKRRTINLSIFTNLAGSFSSFSPNKSPRAFQNDVVGLGIVAAMTDLRSTRELTFSAKSPRSRPISIVCSPKPVVNFRGGLKLGRENTDQVDELSESYTCVISHFGDNLVKKRVYFDEDDELENYSVFFTSSSPINIGGEVKTEFWNENFLSSCFLCQKRLHGLDIFMYRGEKAFCSAECRERQIRSDADDLKEKCGAEARKQLDYSVSPCSRPPPIFTGVAVA